jgi:hypothetical protein
LDCNFKQSKDILIIKNSYSMRKLNKLVAMSFLALAGLVSSYAQTLLSTLTDANGNLLSSTTLTAGTDWILDGKVYVLDGQVLTIEPGTVVKALWGQGIDAPAVIVTRGGKIYANGRKDAPIIFTSIADPLSPADQADPYAASNKEKWGGIILLGKAYNNVLVTDRNPDGSEVVGVANGVGYIEGLDYPDARHQYGATSWYDENGDVTTVLSEDPNVVRIPIFDDEDNSGVLRYVSIRHGGSEIGTANEINGLTCGSVGNKTVLEHIEVVANGDDGIEFFGGTVNIKYASVLFCEDDYIDTDQGYKGKGQFIYGLMLPQTTGDVVTENGDHGFEWDGNDKDDRAITSNPHFTNITLICWGGDKGLELKEETRGEISNAIIAGAPVACAFDVTGADAVTFPDSILVRDVLFLNCGAPTGHTQAELEAQGCEFVGTNASPVTNIIDDVIGINVTLLSGDTIYVHQVTDLVNPVPEVGTSEIETSYAPWEDDDFFTYAPYKGAFEPGAAPWTQEWTAHAYWRNDEAVNDCPTDLNKDGETGFPDLLILGAEYGNACP